MKFKLEHLLFATAVFTTINLMASAENSEILSRRWDAEWIEVPGTKSGAYTVQHFRKEFWLESEPSRFLVHVSGDSRYKFYVNGELASLGPAAGDYYYWNFESVDIAPWLKTGENVVAALVWNEGEFRQESQISYKTGFILQGDGESEAILNTNNTWRCLNSEAYEPLPGIGYNTYYVCGPGERFDSNKSPQGWMHAGFDDSEWKSPSRIGWPGKGSPKWTRDAAGWMLIPRSIPSMELTPQRFASVRRSSKSELPKSIVEVDANFGVAANSEVTVLLDHGTLTNAYPKLQLSGGKESEISLTYNESLFEESPEFGPYKKGHRDEIENKTMKGRRDLFISNGQENQVYETLSWRTFRYVELKIKTKDEPLLLNDISSVFVGYPFEMNARLDTDNPELAKMLEIGWRTARLCAVETYMDCPYYEQLQYIGDARIQALVSLYNSGDDRLLKNALNLMDHSRIAEGITLSRHPSNTPQIITTFSLWYIGMLRDYWWYGSDPDFVSEKLSGVPQILGFFERYQTEDGTLRNLPYWVFTDWMDDQPGWDYGEAPKGANGESSALDFQLLWALQTASELEAALGFEDHAKRYEEKAKQLKASIHDQYWDQERRLFADTASEPRYFSQHSNTLAILTKTVTGEESNALALRIADDPEIAQASIYFRYYLHQALAKAGLGNEYVSWLDKWRENINLGLTTWAEKSEVETSRSDCHAWGSSPNIEFFRIVLGIDSDAPGFSKVKIEPHLGQLKKASGAIPHPAGEISVSYQNTGKAWKIEINLPDSIAGELIWQEESIVLTPGQNTLIR